MAIRRELSLMIRLAVSRIPACAGRTNRRTDILQQHSPRCALHRAVKTATIGEMFSSKCTRNYSWHPGGLHPDPLVGSPRPSSYRDKGWVLAGREGGAKEGGMEKGGKGWERKERGRDVGAVFVCSFTFTAITGDGNVRCGVCYRCHSSGQVALLSQRGCAMRGCAMLRVCQ